MPLLNSKKTAVVVVMTLSNRLFTEFIDPKDDRIHSPKDEGEPSCLSSSVRGSNVAQALRTIPDQIRVHKVVNFKPMWWLSGVMGQHNNYDGEVLARRCGTGGAVVGLTPVRAVQAIGSSMRKCRALPGRPCSPRWDGPQRRPIRVGRTRTPPPRRVRRPMGRR